MQAGLGQLKLSNRARSIESVLAEEETPERVKRLLRLVSEVKLFGETRGLKATPNYTDYVRWDDVAVTWIVSASKPYAFQPKVWSFPVVGSFTYVGWFDRARAQKFADEEALQGWDTDVRGASAYSTLGWFRDPVISTMFREGDAEIGDFSHLLLHESVHATLYFENQSSLNESMAEFIADRITPDFLDQRFGPKSVERAAFDKLQRDSKMRGERMKSAYEELEKLYGSGASDDIKAKEKLRIFSALESALGTKRKLNNASLIQFKTYGTGERAFDLLWKRVGGDLRVFLQEASRLKDSKTETQRDDLDKWIIQELSLLP